MASDTIVEGETGLEAAAAPKPRSEWTMAWRRLRRNKAALAGLAVLIVISLAAIFADVIATEPENHFDIMAAELPPGSEGHPLGTDDIGRDVFSRIVRGSRISLRVGFSAVTISAIAGTLIGLSAGYFGRWVDMVISRIIDVMLAFPGLLLAMTVVAALGSGLNNAMIALGVAGIPFYARVVRSTTLAARELVYVRAARAVGMSDARIMLRHILPNIVSPILIMATLGSGRGHPGRRGLELPGPGRRAPVARVGPGAVVEPAPAAVVVVDLDV